MKNFSLVTDLVEMNMLKNSLNVVNINDSGIAMNNLLTI